MTGNTDLQTSIVKFAKDNPEASGEEIASVVGCSPSYAREIKKNYLQSIIGENDLYDYNFGYTFSNPYSIIATEDFITKFGFEDTKVVEVEVEHEDSTIMIRSPLKPISDISSLQESQSFIYGLFDIAPEFPENIESDFSQYIDSSSENRLSIFTSEAFESFHTDVSGYLESMHRNSDVLVGVGILSSGISYESDQLKLPRMRLRGFKQIISDDEPRILDIRKYDDELISVDSIYFRSTHILPDYINEEVIEYIRNQRYFDLNRTYFAWGVEPVIGPETIEAHGGVVDLENTEILFSGYESLGAIYHPTGENEDLNTDIPVFQDIVQLVDSSSFSIESEDLSLNISTDIDYESELIFFMINSTVVQLQYANGAIFTTYMTGSEVVKNIAQEMIRYFSRELGDLIMFDEPLPMDFEFDSMSDNWVFDTNAIYHQIVGDDASSILKSILPSRQLYNRTITICWPVLYEINKHKDISGPPPSVQEVGIDNLKTLKLLDKYQYIKLLVDSIPENIRTKVSESHIADMHVWQHAQDSEAILVTGDKRLRELAEVSSTKVIDIKDLAEVEHTPDLKLEIWDDIHTEIGVNIHDRIDIVGRIEEVQTDLEDKPKTLVEGSQTSPESYIDQWVDDGDLIEYYYEDKEDGEAGGSLRYDKTVNLDIVLTPSAATNLVEYICEYDNEKYLNGEVLVKLSKLYNLPGPGLPLITFHVPISNVLGPQSMSLAVISAEARQFYRLNDLKNASYVVEDIKGGLNEGIYLTDAIKLAREKKYPILCTKTDRYIKPIGGLLGMIVEELV